MDGMCVTDVCVFQSTHAPGADAADLGHDLRHPSESGIVFQAQLDFSWKVSQVFLILRTATLDDRTNHLSKAECLL
jgi:hypothetical protein